MSGVYLPSRLPARAWSGFTGCFDWRYVRDGANSVGTQVIHSPAFFIIQQGIRSSFMSL